MTLGEVCTIKKNDPDADFWLKSSGNEKNIGKPHKKFDPNDFGIKVTRTDILVSGYLYYVFEWLQTQGKLNQLANGSAIRTLDAETLKALTLGQ